MREVIINGHTLELFDSVDDLPVVRHHRLMEFATLSAGIGSTSEDWDDHIGATIQMIAKGDKDQARMRLLNLRQSIQFASEQIHPTEMAFACFVNKIDGVHFDDLTDHGIKKFLIERLAKTQISWGMIKSLVNLIKKKLKMN